MVPPWSHQNNGPATQHHSPLPAFGLRRSVRGPRLTYVHGIAADTWRYIAISRKSAPHRILSPLIKRPFTMQAFADETSTLPGDNSVQPIFQFPRD